MLTRMVRLRKALAAAVLAGLAGAAPSLAGTVEALRVERLPASLAGTWEFALGDPPGGAAELDGLPFRPVRVPGSWQEAGVPGHGTGWYRVTFDLDPSLAIVPLAFVTRQIRDVDEVFLDGQPIGRTGEFPPDYDKGTLVERIYELPPSRSAVPGRHTLAIRVYNAGPRDGGITAEPRIDSVSTAFHGRALREAPRALLAAAFAALGLFSLFFFLRDRGQPDFLLFFLTTSATALFIVSWLSFWATSGLPLGFLFRVGHAGVFALPAMTLLLFLKFFERTLGAPHRAVLALQGAGTLACLLWPRADDLYYLLPGAYLLGALGASDVLRHLVVSSRRRAPHARLILGATLVAIAAALVDGANVLGLSLGFSLEFALSGPGFFLLLSAFLASMADRLARLRLAASTDPLTGLANRRMLEARFGDCAVRAAGRHGSIAIVRLDLDGFAAVNRSLGESAGDEILRCIARRLAATAGSAALVARERSDSFIVLLPEPDLPGSAEQFADRLLRAVAEPFEFGGGPQRITASAGLALYPQDGRNLDTLLRNAKGALEQALRLGGNCCSAFHTRLDGPGFDSSQLERGLRHALQADELALHFQPLVDARSGRTHAGEALLRWRHPDLGLLPYRQFMGAVGDPRLLADVGDWVLATACHHAADWPPAHDGTRLRLTVNVSVEQLMRGDFAARVAAALRTSGLKADRLELDLDEKVLALDSPTLAATLERIAATGVRLSIDDFGTGYSSLAYLKRLPIQELKIDKAFVRDAPTDPDDAALVEIILAVATHLRLRVVAEGVETEAQAAFLNARAEVIHQGYLYGKPEPAEIWLARWQVAPAGFQVANRSANRPAGD